ncbi:sigma-54-dependent Fis family transcriptional regulator [Thiothrix nivea]|uniref:Sigma54 specific transcriptional regulator, Fis family n=1 Tax=Thiothrix nivea (strain ATCC 35100 / DSM 5205 / JP2) TaxID=870187 RepID=A0A656HMD2_THINJ|nr:sigma-54-dependent Fis family transcriptional regulator [Thiothrix nivea]EIJ36686.1 sigma54 specific transcriptional regulator, Fis family [Thiothrix nivea DSM 5205]
MSGQGKKFTYPSNQDLKAMIRFEGDSGNIWLGQQRMILLHASAFGSMRSELIESFGEDYARGILMRMGYAAAQSDAQLARQIRADDDLMDAFLVGPQLHALEGVVSVEPVRMDIDFASGHFYGEFTWKNSFEAAEHMRLYGLSDHAVCWNLLGYATGYTSTFMGRPVYFKEVECVGKGDKQCRIIGKPLEEWEDADELQQLFSLNSMAQKLHSLEEEVQFLRKEITACARPENIIAESPQIKEIMYLLHKAAETDVTVLMLGETGVGKEVFSQALHRMGKRRDGPFIAVNCAALPRELVESELFGVEKGGYTSADKSRPGRFERADGGTLFLDELGELNARAQAKLLRAIQTGEFERVGGTKKIKVDVRLIAATNANLLEMVRDGRFRADLYYRLNVFPITIPPLRERRTDIPGLIRKFIDKYNGKYGKQVLGVTDDTLRRFSAYQWPGNIRELENILERGVILAENDARIESTHICLGMPHPTDEFMVIGKDGNLEPGATSPDVLEDLLTRMIQSGIDFETLEKQILDKALQKAGGNVLETARMLGISGPQCRYRLKKLGLA